MIDYEKTYFAPMAREDDPYGEWQLVEIKIERKGHLSKGIPLVEGYAPHYYINEYFEWLLYTNVILENKG